MKTILVLTDFSKNATHAAAEALALSGQLRADLLLFNTCISYPANVPYAGAACVADDFLERQTQSKLALEMLTERLGAVGDDLDRSDRIPSVYWQSEDCELALYVRDICRHSNIELIVMGTRDNNKGELLYGEDTDAVIEHAKRPVLIFPAKTNLKQICKIVFVIDVIHVMTVRGEAETVDEHKRAFTEAFAKLRYQRMAYHELSGSDVIAKLQHICKNGTGLLAILHHQHSFFARLFKQSKATDLLISQKLPLLVFPD